MTRGRDALATAGWYNGRDVRDDALSAILRTVALVEPVADGAVWALFPAAERVLREFHGLRVQPTGPGHDVAATGCVIDPTEARHALRPFTLLAESLGSRLFPFGRTDADALLAVDEKGRLFSIDHGGRWHLGDTVPEGLAALAEGRAPHRIAAQRWAWIAPSTADGKPLVNAVRTALVATYVLHHRRVFSARDLRLTVTALRGIGAEVLNRTVPLPSGSLEESATPLAAGMEALIEAEGVTVRGAELTVTVSAPQNTSAPLSSVSCAVRIGHSAKAPGMTELSLSAGAGASVGESRAAVQACSEDLTRYTRRSSP
ncbi:SUKH-3 domain-containing protein [Streptomyces sp. 35G-GA-8]|uniref:SUKH-3 domain-containing protein n=1 Tax=Streptomyces sp. 35G-GA-8 TaxID=2939434 RepID=UPI00201EE118|nr:SUKH-3 domain-containing protein [Streptomyces sp. 35G-GA-8]MCL7381525.1 SUKH-3 domain-containing protein [Streptomyces sp. 35G-GA-8]